MSKAWNARSPEERREVEAAFVARHRARLLLDGDAETAGASGTRPGETRAEAGAGEGVGADAGAETGTEPEAGAGTRAGTGTGRGPRVPFARLYAALHGGGPLPPEVSAALRGDRGLRDDFALLLERCAWQHLPRAAAAAGREDLRRREAGGFVVRLVASRAGDDQVYLLVELPEETRAGAPGRLVVRTADGEFLKQALPSPEARTIRLVMTADDPLVQAVAEPASEVFLL